MPTSPARVHKHPMLPFAPLPSPAAERRHARDRWHPEPETLLLAAAGAARVLGVDRGVTRVLAKALGPL